MTTTSGLAVDEPVGSGGAPRGRAGGGRGRRWAAVAVVVAVLVAVVVVVARRGSPSAVESPTAHQQVSGLPELGAAAAVEVDNPALNDVGDPYVLPVAAGTDGLRAPGYALYWTTDWSANVPAAVSSDLVHWRRVPDALPVLPPWALVVSPPPSWSTAPGVSTMTWGPTVHAVPGGWALYYATEDAAVRRECIGVGFSTSPTGPFTASSPAPLVCQATLGGDIDPSVVSSGPGHLALVWKNDGNSAGLPVGIWEQALAPDGLAVTGAPVRLLGADQAWEHGIVEGPAMLADTRGGWWLFYSGGTWQSGSYDTGVAWCATVAGPCREPVATPLLSSTPTAVSPGGLDTFVDHQGRLWASYSAFPSQPANAEAAMASPRVLELARVLSH